MTKINYGPAHPSVHGAFRLILDVEGERINSVTPDIGYMYRGIEKLIESKSYPAVIPYLDRVDYVSAASQEYSYVLAVEQLLQIDVPLRAQFIRVLVAELTRISNHMLHINMLTYDTGALSPFVWAMEVREKIMWIFERISGARMHLNYFRIGGVERDISYDIFQDLPSLLHEITSTVNDIESVINDNKIFQQRTRNIGVISKEQALAHGVTGSTLRASGFSWDLRKSNPYDVYAKMSFEIPIGETGDCYDRYMVKTNEIKQSVSIIEQCIDQMPAGAIRSDDKRYSPPYDMKHGDIVYHIKHYCDGFNTPEGIVYQATESPKGEFGVLLVSDGTNRPYRCHLRSAGFPVIGLLNKIVDNIADLPVVLASLDIVLGEVDR